MQKIQGVGVWSSELRWGDQDAAVADAVELEELGYSTLWIPDVGGDVFGAVERLMAATSTVNIATGILNIWMHDAAETASEHSRLVDAYGDRFMVGLGVSPAPVVDREEPGRYAKPLAAMATYLDGLDAAETPLRPQVRALAALGPKMLALAAERTGGVHPYNTTAEHTAIARQAIGPDGWLMPEQAVTLNTDPAAARATGRKFLEHYMLMPNYVNHWRRLGMSEDDFTDGGSDRLIDTIIARGDEAAIAARVREHFDAGADHVCIQVLAADDDARRDSWRRLAPALMS